MGLLCAIILTFLPFKQFSEEEIDLMARVVMSESSVEPFEVKQGVAQTILNRLYSENYPDILEDVIRGQFSTEDNGEPNQDCYDAVIFAIENPYVFPTDMYWFRADHYHSFANPYQHIPGTNTWFSTETDYNAIFLEE